MSITSLTINATATDGQVVPFGFNPVLSKAGRTTKFIAPLSNPGEGEGSGSAKDLKAMFKAQGVKGRALTEKVNEALRQGLNVRQARLLLFITTAVNNGIIPSHIEANAAGTEFRPVLVRAKEKVQSESVKLKAAKSEADALAKEAQALKEQIAAMKANEEKLAALLAAAGIAAE